MATSTKPQPSARETALKALKRQRSGKGYSAKALGERICSGSRFNPEAKYAMANARKVIYSMHRDGELERSEDGLYSLAPDQG